MNLFILIIVAAIQYKNRYTKFREKTNFNFHMNVCRSNLSLDEFNKALSRLLQHICTVYLQIEFHDLGHIISCVMIGVHTVDFVLHFGSCSKRFG